MSKVSERRSLGADWNEERSHNYPLSLPLSTAYRLTRIEGRGKMTLSSPYAQEAVVRVDDPDYGAAWYEFELRVE